MITRPTGIPLDLTKADWMGGASYTLDEQGLLASFPPTGGAIVLTSESMGMGGADWTGITHVVFEVTGLLPMHDLSMFIEFREFADYRVGNTGGVHIGALPECRTQLMIDIQSLDSRQMHLVRTKGRLKAGVTGRGMDIADARVKNIRRKTRNGGMRYTPHPPIVVTAQQKLRRRPPAAGDFIPRHHWLRMKVL